MQNKTTPFKKLVYLLDPPENNENKNMFTITSTHKYLHVLNNCFSRMLPQ